MTSLTNAIAPIIEIVACLIFPLRTRIAPASRWSEIKPVCAWVIALSRRIFPYDKEPSLPVGAARARACGAGAPIEQTRLSGEADAALRRVATAIQCREVVSIRRDPQRCLRVHNIGVIFSDVSYASRFVEMNYGKIGHIGASPVSG